MVVNDEEKIEVDMDITNFGVWLDTKKLFFSWEHKMRFIKWVVLMVVINGS